MVCLLHAGAHCRCEVSASASPMNKAVEASLLHAVCRPQKAVHAVKTGIPVELLFRV